ncbi:spermatogenesis-associated protein 4 [Cladochytrium tenue]|nr:spermatogenesis-associated protein 4 [Cladochytrium tenue]
MAFSREVLRWVQGLNLSFSIKNAKRDFSNGFLIAEILSRYYPSEVAMHAFDTGTGPAARANNWEMLDRAFVKLGIPIHKDMATAVAAGRPESVALMLSVIHTHVRKLK